MRVVCWFVCVLLVFVVVPSASTEDSQRPLRASEVLALQAGGVLPANLAHDIAVRGVTFHTDVSFAAQIKQAGADSTVIAALNSAKITPEGREPEAQLLSELSHAGALIKDKQYDLAADELNRALAANFAGPERGFIMGEVLRQKGDFPGALSVYKEVLAENSEFAEVHTKISYILYKLDDSAGALNEAKAALAINPVDAEAHKNAGLALDSAGKFDAAIAEYKEALRIKPDYTAVHYDLGLLFHHIRSYENAIAEYKKAIALDPNYQDAHNNLGLAYKEVGNFSEAVKELREAKRLDPDDPAARQNLAATLMETSVPEGIAELQELEKRFPNFEMCHVCLGNALVWAGDNPGAAAEYQIAQKLDPSDSAPHRGLGNLLEKQKRYDEALGEYRSAEMLNPNDAEIHEDSGRVLLAKKDIPAAIAELKVAVQLSPASWQIHELYGQALVASKQDDLAISEFKESASLDPKQSQVALELASVLEDAGDWVGALEQYRKASLTQFDNLSKVQPGQSFMLPAQDAQKTYKAAQMRFAAHLQSMKAQGKNVEAEQLEKRVQMLDTSAGTLQKVQMAMQNGTQAFREKRFDDAEKSYKEAVTLAGNLPPGDENLIVALGKLGHAYEMRQDYSDAETVYHRQLSIVEKTFGPEHPRVTDPLLYLGSLALGLKHYAAAESYLSRSLDLQLRNFGEHSQRTSEALRMMAGLYMAQSDWPQSETYLLRAVRAVESPVGQDDALVLIPVWGLCSVYDRWNKPDKAQPCWHRATELMQEQVGENSPDLAESLTQEAKALRALGRTSEAEQLEQRLAKIHPTADIH